MAQIRQVVRRLCAPNRVWAPGDGEAAVTFGAQYWGFRNPQKEQAPDLRSLEPGLALEWGRLAEGTTAVRIRGSQSSSAAIGARSLSGALAPRSRVSNDERPRRGAGPFWGVPQSITVKPLARVSRQPTVIVTRVSSTCYGSIIPMGDRAPLLVAAEQWSAMLFQSH